MTERISKDRLVDIIENSCGWFYADNRQLGDEFLELARELLEARKEIERLTLLANVNLTEALDDARQSHLNAEAAFQKVLAEYKETSDELLAARALLESWLEEWSGYVKASDRARARVLAFVADRVAEETEEAR